MTDAAAIAKSPPNPPAFGSPDDLGMSLRDWFAGQSLNVVLEALEKSTPGLAPSEAGRALLEAGRVAYRIADAMLAARGENQP